jgi:hypothetical protein
MQTEVAQRVASCERICVASSEWGGGSCGELVSSTYGGPDAGAVRQLPTELGPFLLINKKSYTQHLIHVNIDPLS